MGLQEQHKFMRRITAADLPNGTGPDGEKLCAWCDQPSTGKKIIRYCSAPCREAVELRVSASYVRHRLRQRDHGVCALCKLNTETIRAAGRELKGRFYALKFREESLEPWKTALAKLREDYPWVRLFNHGAVKGHLWEADHIIPVSEGGGACGLDNLRTLCLPCHWKETGLLRRRLNAAKREQDAN